MPQPNLVPVRRARSRRYHKSGMDGSPAKLAGFPLTVSSMATWISAATCDGRAQRGARVPPPVADSTRLVATRATWASNAGGALLGACCARDPARTQRLAAVAEADMEKVKAPDFASGVAGDDVPDGGMLQGKLGDEDVILARQGAEFFAFGAKCTHYGGPLGKGLMIGDEVRCPLHHACFSLRTGAVLRPPAFDPIPCWRVEHVGARLFLREKLPAPVRAPGVVSSDGSKAPASVVIVGGGGAGLAAADTLRQEGYDGPITLLSADESPPYDRPNLSKDYLAGSAPDEWLPLRSPEYYTDRRIELSLNSRVASLDIRQKRVQTENGRTYDFD